MPWTKVTRLDRSCAAPLFWSFKPVGSLWECPRCGKVWEVKANPDMFIGGKVFLPRKQSEHGLCRPTED